MKYANAERSFGMRNEGHLEDDDHKPIAHILCCVTDASHEPLNLHDNTCLALLDHIPMLLLLVVILIHAFPFSGKYYVLKTVISCL